MDIEQVRQFLEEINSRESDVEKYETMSIEELGEKLRESMRFEQEIFQKIEEFEKNDIEWDLINYTKTMCKNITQREITAIQDVYLKKIDSEVLKK